MMKIPTSFQIFAHTYTVVFDPDLFLKENIFGEFDADLKKIRLQTPMRIIKKRLIVDENEVESYEDVEFEITADVVMETFYHELTHCILEATNTKDEIYSDETLVGNFGQSLLQVMKCIEKEKSLYEYRA